MMKDKERENEIKQLQLMVANLSNQILQQKGLDDKAKQKKKKKNKAGGED